MASSHSRITAPNSPGLSSRPRHDVEQATCQPAQDVLEKKYGYIFLSFAGEGVRGFAQTTPFLAELVEKKQMIASKTTPMPGDELKAEKMPGHWLLARLGKRVLRPGGRQLTNRLIEGLHIEPADEVIEFAPGLGETARLTLKRKPSNYTAVERDKDAAALVQKFLQGADQRCVVGLAEETGLPDASATVVYGEAMLSMQPPQHKEQIVREACRLLKPGGRYGIHELCLIPNDLDECTKTEIQNELAAAIHHATRPLTIAEWQVLLEAEGFSIQTQAQAPMHLLEPWRIIQDEGMFGALRFALNVLCHRDARRRVLAMRRVFRKYRDHLAAVVIVGQKKEKVPQ